MTVVIGKDHLFEMYIPTQCICGEELDHELRANVLRNVQTNFSGWFCNFNVITIPGGWVLPNGSSANEQNDVVVRSYATNEEFQKYTDEVKRLAQFVADELTQDRVAITIDGKILFSPRSSPDSLCDHGQMVKSTAISTITTQSQKLKVIYTSLSTLTDIRDLQNLVCGVLSYRNCRRRYIPCSDWPSSIRDLLVAIPSIMADDNGFKVIFVRINRPRILLAIERLIVRHIYHDNPEFSGIFVFTNQPQNQWELVNAKTSGTNDGNPVIRRIRLGKGERVRAAAERILLTDLSEADESFSAVQIQELHEKAFDFV